MNTVHTGVFTYEPNNRDWITGAGNSMSKCEDDKEYLFDKEYWSLFTDYISLESNSELDKLVPEGHNFPCLHSDGY